MGAILLVSLLLISSTHALVAPIRHGAVVMKKGKKSQVRGAPGSQATTSALTRAHAPARRLAGLPSGPSHSCRLPPLPRLPPADPPSKCAEHPSVLLASLHESLRVAVRARPTTRPIIHVGRAAPSSTRQPMAARQRFAPSVGCGRQRAYISRRVGGGYSQGARKRGVCLSCKCSVRPFRHRSQRRGLSHPIRGNPSRLCSKGDAGRIAPSSSLF